MKMNFSSALVDCLPIIMQLTPQNLLLLLFISCAFGKPKPTPKPKADPKPKPENWLQGNNGLR